VKERNKIIKVAGQKEKEIPPSLFFQNSANNNNYYYYYIFLTHFAP